MSRRRRQLVAGLAAASLISLVACDALLGLHDPTGTLLDTSDAGDVGDGATTPPLDAPVDTPFDVVFTDVHCGEDQSPCDGKCVYLATDPNNCGQCQHVCSLLPSCQSGLCQPGELDAPGNGKILGIAASANVLYAFTDDQVLITGIDPESVGALSGLVAFTTFDGGTIRSLAPTSTGVAVAVGPGGAIVYLTASSSTTLVADAGDPLSLASYGDTLYWASSDPSADAIMQAAVSPSPPPPPSVLVSLQPGDRPCALAASADGIFWTGARGTFMENPAGDAQVALTTTPFDDSVAPLGGGAALVAAEDGGLTYVAPPASPEVIPTPAPIFAVALADTVAYAAGIGVYELGVLADGGVQSMLISTGTVSPACNAPVLAVLGPYVAWVDGNTGTVQYVINQVPMP